jgi:hypothetical protein
VPEEAAAAVIEAPEASSASSEEISAPEPGPGSSGKPGAHESADGGESTPQEGAEFRANELYRAVKEQLKSFDPKHALAVRNAIFSAEKLREKIGGDLRAFEAAQAAYARLGDDASSGQTPEQIVEETIAERQFWRDFDDKFEKGDPALIPQMVEANPEAFQKLVLPALNKFAEMNPEGYSSIISQAAVGYLDSNQIPLMFQILDTFLPGMPDFPGKPQVLEAINRVYQSFEALRGMAGKPIAPKGGENGAQKSGGLDQREETLRAREHAATRSEWQAETERPGIELREQTMNRVAAAAKVTLTEAEKDKIRSAVREEINARCAADRRYGEAMRAYVDAANKKAYQDKAASMYKLHIPGATTRHTQAVIEERKTAPKPAANGNLQPKTATPAPRGTQPDGNGNLIQWISGHPRTLGKDVDYTRTTQGMLLRNEAYLKGERALYKWRGQK